MKKFLVCMFILLFGVFGVATTFTLSDKQVEKKEIVETIAIVACCITSLFAIAIMISIL